MKIVFMGSPDFAVPSLVELAQNKDIEIRGVVTQPDRRKGRGQQKQPTPVKKKSKELNLDVFAGDDVNQEQFILKLQEFELDFIVTAAFGQILSAELLALPALGCINLHASLLPRYRGASPIQMAIVNGDQYSGVTTMYMDEGLDSGDIIYRQKVKILNDDTAGKLHDRLADIGAPLLVKTLQDIKQGTAPRIEQDESQSSYAPLLDKKFGEIDWTETAPDIYNLVRGVNPWPGAYTYLDGQYLKIWQTEVITGDSDKKPGEVVIADCEQGLIIQTGNQQLRISKLQLSGRRKMSDIKFLRGCGLRPGQKLG